MSQGQNKTDEKKTNHQVLAQSKLKAEHLFSVYENANLCSYSGNTSSRDASKSQKEIIYIIQ